MIEDIHFETDDGKYLKNNKPSRYHLLFYCTSYRLNMFRALLCPSSGARDYDVDYHIGRFFLGLLYVGGKVRLGWSSVRVAALLMMGIVVPEIC